MTNGKNGDIIDCTSSTINESQYGTLELVCSVLSRDEYFQGLKSGKQGLNFVLVVIILKKPGYPIDNCLNDAM